jgi:hypothetical protein
MTERKKASKQVHLKQALLFSSGTKPKPNSPTRQKPKTGRRRKNEKHHATAKPRQRALAIATKTLQRRLRIPASLPA